MPEGNKTVKTKRRKLTTLWWRHVALRASISLGMNFWRYSFGACRFDTILMATYSIKNTQLTTTILIFSCFSIFFYFQYHEVKYLGLSFSGYFNIAIVTYNFLQCYVLSCASHLQDVGYSLAYSPARRPF